MDYLFLTRNDFTGLRRERVTSLEAEHYRLSLMVDEAVDEQELTRIAAQRAEIERRLTVHIEALTAELEAIKGDEPEMAATEGT